MVDLQSVYEDAGLKIIPGELPDFLPLFLEYLSLLPVKEASDVLGESINIISTIAKRLEIQNNLYCAVFLALEDLSSAKADPNIIKRISQNIHDINDKNKLDKEWNESPAFSNQGASNGIF
jgi:nitrate reductase delta subunit